MIYGRETSEAHICWTFFFFFPQLKIEGSTQKCICTGTQDRKRKSVIPPLKKTSLCSNYLYKNPQNNFYSCKWRNGFKWNVIRWLCVCWQNFHNEQVAILFDVYISHIWLEVANLHCLGKLNRWVLILYDGESPHLLLGLLLHAARDW